MKATSCAFQARFTRPDVSRRAWALRSQCTPACTEILDRLSRDDKAPEVRELAANAARVCRGEKVEGYETLYRTFFINYEN